MKNYINGFFRFLSGRPKSGNVVECFKPFIDIPILIVAIILEVYSIKHQDPIYGFMAMVSCWQLGWGMSMMRFIKSKDDDDE